MQTIITIIHVLACIFLVLVVLLQTGKGADMGAVFGGSSATVFGSTGAGNFLTRLTTASAIIFMLTSLSLTYLSSHQTTATVFDSAPATESAAPAPEEMPAGPETEVLPQAANAGAEAPAQPPAAAPAQAPAQAPAAAPAEAPAGAPAQAPAGAPAQP